MPYFTQSPDSFDSSQMWNPVKHEMPAFDDGADDTSSSPALSVGQVRFCEHGCCFDKQLIALRVSLVMIGVRF